MADVSIQASPNGPYMVKGDAEILDAEGNRYEASGGAVALCRCGQSGNKPFCDGTHAKVEFRSEPKAGS